MGYIKYEYILHIFYLTYFYVTGATIEMGSGDEAEEAAEEILPGFGEPRVIKRVYKIQFQPENRTSSKGSVKNIQHRKSMKAYDRDTDNDIFELGSAFQDGVFNIDDFLKTWSTNTGYKVEKISTAEKTKTDEQTSTMENQTHLSSCVTKKSSASTASETVRHTVFPFIKRERLVTSLRPGDGEVTSTLTTSISSTNNSQEEIQNFTMKNNEEIYTPEVTHVKTSKSQVQKQESIVSDTQEIHSYESNKVSKSESIMSTTLHEKTEAKIDLSGTEACMSSSDEDITVPRRAAFPKAAVVHKKIKFRGKKGGFYPRGNAEAGKGKGMTAPELNFVGAARRLPAMQQIVLNYNRMLDLKPEQFVDTLFRAVKLNGVDVVKVMCQLAIRKNYKLSSDDMREPESSATVLHVALLYDNDEIVHHLLDINDRDLIMSTYINDDYKDQTVLHVAVANGNSHLVARLLGMLPKKYRKTLINTVATGLYFQDCHPDGQLCVTAAAWAGHPDMLIMLAKYGANLGLQNLSGDTLLHRIVEASTLHPKIDYQKMIDKTFEAVGEWAKHCHYNSRIPDQVTLERAQKQINTFQHMLNITNDDGYVPLALAAKNGSPLIHYFLNFEKIYKIPQTKLGSISWVTYDVTDIATYTHGYYGKFSVLHILAHNKGQLSSSSNQESGQNHSVLETEPFKSLLIMKWRIYRWVYIAWCLIHLINVIAFTYATYNINSCPYEDPYDSYHQIKAEPYSHWYGLFCILPVVYIFLEAIDLFGSYPYSFQYMYNQKLLKKLVKRVQSEWVITGNGPYRLVMVAHSISTLFWFVLYITRHEYQNSTLAMAVLLGWIFVLFFTRGCRVISRFSIMMQKMFFRDLAYFLAVYVVILLGFSFAVNAMFTHLHQSDIELPRIVYRMMNIITELDGRATLGESRNPLFTQMLMIMYAIVAVILLMNMLIAMMNTSYEAVRATSGNLWKQQQLSILLMLERRLFWVKCLCKASERDVWHKEWEEGVKSYLDVTITQI